MKTIYIKRSGKTKPDKIECEEYSLSGNFLATIDKDGNRTYYMLTLISEIFIPKSN
jgi:hypothetical protein